MISSVILNSFNCLELAYYFVELSADPSVFVGQMEEMVVIDEHGHVHSAWLHWDGLSRLLCELLSAARYPQPPLYEGHDFVEDGVRSCSVTMVIPQHQLNVWWASIVT